MASPRSTRAKTALGLWDRPAYRQSADGCLQPRESSSAVVLLDVAVVLIGRKAGDDAGDAVGQPPGVADRKEVFQAVPQADGSLNVGEIELPGVVDGAVVIPGTIVVEGPVVTSVQDVAGAQGEGLGPLSAVRGILLGAVGPPVQPPVSRAPLGQRHR